VFPWLAGCRIEKKLLCGAGVEIKIKDVHELARPLIETLVANTPELPSETHDRTLVSYTMFDEIYLGPRRVPVLAQQYVISTDAGGPPVPAAIRGLDAAIGTPISIATDPAGNLYFASTDLNGILRRDTEGILTRIAGNSRPGYSGDGGLAFIADTSNHRIRRVSPEGTIATVAGNGTQGFSGDSGPPRDAQLNWQ